MKNLKNQKNQKKENKFSDPGMDISGVGGISFVKQEFPARFRRPLTRADCKKGFHLFDGVGQDNAFLYEKCSVCGEVISYMKGVAESFYKKKWSDNHKLDLLQPNGHTLKDFIEYYGKPFKR